MEKHREPDELCARVRLHQILLIIGEIAIKKKRLDLSLLYIRML